MPPWFMAVTIGAILLGAIILYFAITHMVALLRDAEVARLPAAAEGTVAFSAAGSYVLHIEQPRFNLALMRAQFSMRNAATGEEVRSSPVIFRTTTSGIAKASISVRQFEVEHPGAYRLLVSGVDPAADRSKIELIFTRPYATALFALIVGTVFGGACVIGGLVFTALLHAGKL